jgi:hypothetical protein
VADGGQLKLGRARKHIIEAREITRTWIDSEAFTIGRTTDRRTGRAEARVQLQASPPDELALAVGDAIHNLRGALDHAVFDAALRHAGGSLTEKDERALSFPVLNPAPPEGFEKKTAAQLPHVPAAVRQVIEDVPAVPLERRDLS